MKLKPEYKDQIVKVNAGFGLVTFDTTETPETDYPTLAALGFDFCFEPEVPKYKEPIYYKGVLGMEEATKMGLIVESTKRNKKRNDQTSKAKSKKA